MSLVLNGSGTITGATTLASTVTSPTLTTPVITSTLGVGNATPSASGAGITFPATQSASTDANTLDDYEEGTFSPSFTATGYTFSYTTNAGTYTKIGNQVIARCYIRLAGNPTGSGGTNLILSGLPFVSKVQNTNFTGHAIVIEASSTLFTGVPGIRMNSGSTVAAVFDIKVNASPTTIITPSNMNSSMEWELFVQYITD